MEEKKKIKKILKKTVSNENKTTSNIEKKIDKKKSLTKK